VVETIAHCKQNNLRGSVLAVDMAKAFDSLNHMFVKSVYKFLGKKLTKNYENNESFCVNKNSRENDAGSENPMKNSNSKRQNVKEQMRKTM
jgi:hypothetical protein